MVKAKELTKIPVIYQKLQEYEEGDSRFVKVRIWLMHTGENYNGSFFDKEVVDGAVPTLANTPIVTYVENNSQGDKDFSDHRIVIHRTEEGEFDLRYEGVAIGLIPETNNAHWEKRVADDGVEREYLVVDALLWTKWDDAVEIMMNREGKVAQSMELSEEYQGYFDTEGLFHFTQFQFNGACLLGVDYLPAMEGSTAELTFNQDVHKNIEEKLHEFYTKFSQEGGKTVAKDKKSAEFEKNKEEVDNSVVDDMEETPAADKKTDETPVKDAEKKDEQKKDEPKTEHEKDKEELPLNPDKKEVEQPLTEEVPLPEDQKPMNPDPDPDAPKKDDEPDFPHKKDTPKVDDEPNFEEKFKELQAAYDELKANHDNMYAALRQREEQDVREKFKDRLTEEEMNQVFENHKDEDMKEIEKELFSILGEKSYDGTFNFTTQFSSAKMTIPPMKEKSKAFGGLLEGFEKK